MIKADKVNEIWAVLPGAMESAIAQFGARYIGIGEMVDFVAAEVQKLGPWSREDVVEAWLYRELHQVAVDNLVPNHPRGPTH